MIDMSQTGSWAFQSGQVSGLSGTRNRSVSWAFPLTGLGGVDRVQVGPLRHPIRGYKRWLRRRRLGPYAVEEDQGY